MVTRKFKYVGVYKYVGTSMCVRNTIVWKHPSVCVHASACGGQRTSSDVILQLLPLLFISLKHGLLCCEVTEWPNPVNAREQPIAPSQQ